MTNDPTGPTEEELQVHEQLCSQIDKVCRDAPSYDAALMALTSVLAQFCTECDHEAETCLTVCEDLLADFRDKMENRPAETIITIPEQN